MKPVIEAMAEQITRGEPFALATVIRRNGSAPRSAGARMLVRPDGATRGTVGGGILEADVEKLAGQVLRDHAAVRREFEFSGKDAATMNAICGGRVEVLVEWLDPADPQTRAVIQGLQAAVAAHRKTWLITALPSPGGPAGHILVHADGSLTGILPDGLTIDTIQETRLLAVVKTASAEWLVEPLDIAGTVYIFGAGHVSRSLAEFTRAVGFWTVVLDDRPEYVSAERFPTADERIVLDSFENALGRLSIDRDSSIVIVTRGHLHDRTVLAQVLKTGAGYIGMIGSRRKCGLIFEELLKSGFTPEDLQRVHAPIGLPIHAETPEEIGISIVAELIQERANIKGMR